MNVIKACRYGMMVFNTNDEWIGRSLDLYGEYSESEVSLFNQLLKPGSTAIDVGSNIGALTIPMARIVGPKGKVVAFEPQQSMFYTLCANAAINNLLNIDCWQVALGKETGHIQVPVVDVTKFGNFGGLPLKGQFGEDVLTKTVPVLTLDSSTIVSCDLIKIDVEGMEQEVLEGSAETIKEHQPYLYVEDDRKESSESLREMLRSMGYSLYSHQPFLYNPRNYFNNPKNELVVETPEGERKPVVSFNILCVPESRPVPENPQLKEIN